MIAPLGKVFQAGTLSGNPLAMAAGIANPRRAEGNRARSIRGCEAVRASWSQASPPPRKMPAYLSPATASAPCSRCSSPTQVTDWETASKSDTATFGRFHGAMLDAGIWLPPSQFEAAFLGLAHTQSDLDATIAAAREALALL